MASHANLGQACHMRRSAKVGTQEDPGEIHFSNPHTIAKHSSATRDGLKRRPCNLVLAFHRLFSAAVVFFSVLSPASNSGVVFAARVVWSVSRDGNLWLRVAAGAVPLPEASWPRQLMIFRQKSLNFQE